MFKKFLGMVLVTVFTFSFSSIYAFEERYNGLSDDNEYEYVYIDEYGNYYSTIDDSSYNGMTTFGNFGYRDNLKKVKINWEDSQKFISVKKVLRAKKHFVTLLEGLHQQF